MEKLDSRIATLFQALNTLDNAVSLEQEEAPDARWALAARDSIVSRYFYTFDLFWKCLKELLEQKYLIFDKSPKSVFRSLVNQNLISAQEGELLLRMSDDRNTMAHEYNFKAAVKIVNHIAEYTVLMRALMEKLQK